MKIEDPIRDEFSALVSRLFKTSGFNSEDEALQILHAAIGISGEAGELLDAVKKLWAYNKPLDISNVREELGDILFYIRALCQALEISEESCMRDTVSKLNKRYPEGYTDAAAQTRADKIETGETK